MRSRHIDTVVTCLGKAPPSTVSFACGLALVLALASGLPAQKVAWQIPERGVVFYKRSYELTPSTVRGYPPAGFTYITNPPVLLQGELDFSQKFLVEPPGNLHELGAWLAFDLRRANKKGKFTATVPLMRPFGSLHIDGTVGKLDEKGRQTIQAQITRKDAVRGHIPPLVYKTDVDPMYRQDLTAKIEIRREIDIEKGLVTRFASRLWGSSTYSKNPMDVSFGKAKTRDGKCDFELTETWRLERVAPNRYPGFRTQVAGAIKLGAAHIKDQVKRILAGRYKMSSGGQGRSYDAGNLALALLTLVKAGEDRRDEVLKQGFDRLRKRVMHDTYSLAVTIMAFEALYAPTNERQSLIEGRIQKPIQRKLPDEDLKLVERLAAQLLTHTDQRIETPSYLRRFSYTKQPSQYDNSNSQYALLGLYSAHLCGAKIPSQVWLACANHWLEDQYVAGGPKASLVLVSHQDYARLKSPVKSGLSRRTVTRARRIQGAGWPYIAPKPRRFRGKDQERMQLLTGSMTCAGITALTICEAVLRDGDPKRLKKERATMQKAVRAGYAWLLQNFSVRKNKHGHGFHFYYLYGLERACELGMVALIGNRDWYFEGSVMLLGMQRKDGTFNGALLYGNCFAVLFLKQAAPPLPVITPGRR